MLYNSQTPRKRITNSQKWYRKHFKESGKCKYSSGQNDCMLDAVDSYACEIHQCKVCIVIKSSKSQITICALVLCVRRIGAPVPPKDILALISQYLQTNLRTIPTKTMVHLIPHGISPRELKSINTDATKNYDYSRDVCPISFQKCKNATKLFCDCDWENYLKDNLNKKNSNDIIKDWVNRNYNRCVNVCTGTSKLLYQTDGYCLQCRQRLHGNGIIGSYVVTMQFVGYKCDHYPSIIKCISRRQCISLCADCGKRKDCLVLKQKNLYK